MFFFPASLFYMRHKDSRCSGVVQRSSTRHTVGVARMVFEYYISSVLHACPNANGEEMVTDLFDQPFRFFCFDLSTVDPPSPPCG